MTSYAPMFRFGDYEICGNAERFATASEAEESARERFSRWTMPTGYFVQESADPVNYKWTADGAKRIGTG
jgi:hypothetical protein